LRFDAQSILTGCILAAIGWLFTATLSHTDRLTALEARMEERLVSINDQLTRVEQKIDRYTAALEYAKWLAESQRREAYPSLTE
jgi:hypothetical protein